MSSFKDFLTEATVSGRPGIDHWFMTAKARFNKEGYHKGLDIAHRIYDMAGGQSDAELAEKTSIKIAGSMSLAFGPDGVKYNKGGAAMKSEADVDHRKFGAGADLVKRAIAAHGSESLGRNGATIHGDIIPVDFTDRVRRTVVPDKTAGIPYHIPVSEDRKMGVAIHGITTSDGRFLLPTPANIKEHVNQSHSNIFTFGTMVGGGNPSKSRMFAGQRLVADARDAVNNVTDESLNLVREHADKHKQIEGWLHSGQTSVTDYLDHLESRKQKAIAEVSAKSYAKPETKQKAIDRVSARHQEIQDDAWRLARPIEEVAKLYNHLRRVNSHMGMIGENLSDSEIKPHQSNGEGIVVHNAPWFDSSIKFVPKEISDRYQKNKRV